MDVIEETAGAAAPTLWVTISQVAIRFAPGDCELSVPLLTAAPVQVPIGRPARALAAYNGR